MNFRVFNGFGEKSYLFKGNVAKLMHEKGLYSSQAKLIFSIKPLLKKTNIIFCHQFPIQDIFFVN